MSEQSERQSSVDLVKLTAGALASMASAVLLSTLGAAGTITGAALGSVLVTVGSALFSKSIDASKQGVTAAQSLTIRRVAQARSQVDRATDEMDGSGSAQQHLAGANADLDQAESDLVAGETEPASAGWRDRLATLSWKRVALGAAALFLVAMVVITGFELVTGRAVSNMTGGSSQKDRTSFSGLTGTGTSSPSPTGTPTGTPSATPSESVGESPSDGASASATPSPSASPSASDQPTASDSAAPDATTAP